MVNRTPAQTKYDRYRRGTRPPSLRVLRQVLMAILSKLVADVGALFLLIAPCNHHLDQWKVGDICDPGTTTGDDSEPNGWR